MFDSTVSKFRLPRRRSALELVFLLFLLLVALYVVFPLASSTKNRGQAIGTIRPRRPDNPLPCYRLPGAEDTVVVFKTSAVELETKMPVHFNTTLQCSPNYMIFSDYREVYQGYHVIDALEFSNKRLREQDSDFELWRRLHRGGPDVLDDEEVWNARETVKDLDKWKWLPMLDRTFQEYPDKKWFVFLESDSFIFWHSLLQWLSTMDHTKMHYIGVLDREAVRTDVLNGGAGIIFSQAAMHAMLQRVRADPSGWDRKTSQHSTGESMLTEAAVQAGIPITESWPVMQNQRPANTDYNSTTRDSHLWCFPTVSHSGTSPVDISEMWSFEHDWIRDYPSQIIRHKDIFNHIILPHLIARSGMMDDWDNFSDEEGLVMKDITECRNLCVQNAACVQFSLAQGRCRLSAVPKMGEYRRDVESRWLLARMQRFADEIDRCNGDESWISE